MVKRLLIVLAVMMLVAMPVLAEDKEQVVALVKGQPITLGELDQAIDLDGFMMQMYQTNPQFTQVLISTEAGQNVLNEYRKQQLDQYATQVLLVLEAKERGLKVTAEKATQIFNQQVQMILSQNQITQEQLLAALSQQGIGSMDDYKKLFLEQNGDYILIDELKQQVMSTVVIADADIQAYYEKNKEQFTQEKAVHARHILVDSEAKAQELLAKVKGGADFATVASEASQGPSAKSGGDLGFFSMGQTVPEFETAAFALKVGEISGVVKTQYGFHIIKVEEIREAGVVPFEQVKAEIKASMLEDKEEQVWNGFIDGLKAKGMIQIKM